MPEPLVVYVDVDDTLVRGIGAKPQVVIDDQRFAAWRRFCAKCIR